jgi:hypothetical protein
LPRPRREASDHPSERRGHGALKFNEKLADQFGIPAPGQEPPRETVKVASLPDPPGVNLAAQQSSQPVNIDEMALNILKEEMSELAFRLENIGVKLTSPMQQEMVDHAFAMLGGGFTVGGGALARR